MEIIKNSSGGNSAELTDHIANTTDAHGIDDLATASALSNHTGNTSNPHGVTKTQVGLGNVTDDAQVKRSEMGAANGVATLDSNGILNSNQIVISSSTPHPFLFF